MLVGALIAIVAFNFSISSGRPFHPGITMTNYQCSIVEAK